MAPKQLPAGMVVETNPKFWTFRIDVGPPARPDDAKLDSEFLYLRHALLMENRGRESAPDFSYSTVLP